MYAQLLFAFSFAIASYQDIKDRAVSDLVWIPAVVGAGYVVYSFFTLQTMQSLEFLIIKIVLIGGIMLGFTFFGYIGQADAIALVFVASDPYPLSPLPALLAGGGVALSHIGYEYAVGNIRDGRKIPMEQFLREQRWIPKAVIADGVRTEVSSDVNVAREEVEAKKLQDASVEVSYGVPTVAYYGIGYVFYLVYLVWSNLPAFLSLP